MRFEAAAPEETAAFRPLATAARARRALASGALAAAAIAALVCAAPAWASSAPVYRCEHGTGRITFTDAPCPAGARGTPWTVAAPSPGIAAAGTRAFTPAPQTLLRQTHDIQPVARSQPWLDCRQRGGRFDPGTRVCQLPPDTIEHMFGSH